MIAVFDDGDSSGCGGSDDDDDRGGADARAVVGDGYRDSGGSIGDDRGVADGRVAVDNGDSSDVGGVDEAGGGTGNHHHDDIDSNGTVDVSVSFDGMWHKRGFTSNYGVGIVIDVATGLVLDHVVLSKYCQSCAQNANRHMDDQERHDWEREHRPYC